MNRYQARLHADGKWAVYDTEKFAPVSADRFNTWSQAHTLAGQINYPPPNPVPAAPGCDGCATRERYKQGFDHLRVALAHVSRTTRDGETANYALNKIAEALAMVQGEPTDAA